MTFRGFADHRQRRRRSALWRLVLFVTPFLLIGAAAGYGYQVGASAKQTRLVQLETALEEVRQTNLDLGDEVTRARERVQTAEAALAELRERYARDVPTGEAARLLAAIEEQLADGTDPERLALLVDAAGKPVDCDGEVETRRFMPRTPVAQGPVSAVRFGGNRITVTGSGTSATSEEGLAEAWFDPAEPVRIRFETLNGGGSSVEGMLPLRHRMVVDGKEYRFGIVAGERAFVEITGQACELPEMQALTRPGDQA